MDESSIRQYFERLQPLPDEAWKAMESCFRSVEFEKGELLLEEGQQCDYIGFIQSGLIRFYHLKDGSEKVTAFWFPGDFLSNYRSFVSNQPSTHFIEAITSGSYYQLKRADLYRLYDEFPVIERLGRLMAEQLYLMVARRLDHFIQYSPEERYLQLQKKNPRLLQEIPQYMVASYLGVSAETLSRIRKRIAR